MSGDVPVAAAPGALAAVPDGAAARLRLAYANLDRLGEVAHLAPRAALLREVLGAPAAGGGTAVRAGDGPVRRRGAERSPNALTVAATSAAQACLGDAVAETIAGPGALGHDTALGIGLRVDADPPAGAKLVVCWAPHYRRDLHAGRRALVSRWPRAEVAETELGERAIVAGVLPAAALPRAELLRALRADARLVR